MDAGCASIMTAWACRYACAWWGSVSERAYGLAHEFAMHVLRLIIFAAVVQVWHVLQVVRVRFFLASFSYSRKLCRWFVSFGIYTTQAMSAYNHEDSSLTRLGARSTSNGGRG